MNCIGTYDGTIFYNPANKFCIVSVKTADQSVPAEARSNRRYKDHLIRFTAVGYEIPRTDAVELELDGEWTKGKYGVQLQVEQWREIVPRTKNGVEGYLASGLIKGIGPKTAADIVERFGVDTLDILEHQPERLLEIRGITESKLEDIKASYAENRMLQGIMTLLAPFKITPKTALKIYQYFGPTSVEILEKSPFELCQISGFGFRRVDAIVQKSGGNLHDPMRIKGAVFCALDEGKSKRGHLYISSEELEKSALKLLNEKIPVPELRLHQQEVRDMMQEMILNGAIVSVKRAIALYLNEHGVPSPSAYKVQKGLPVSTRGYDDPMWGARMIHSILTNPTYTGDLAQGRSRVKSYKVHQIEAVPREEWVEVAGTHEAIIDYETFDKVQALLQRDTRTSPKGREVHLFSGFLKCADCGRAITRCVGKNNNVYYSCSTYKNRSRTACTMHSIKHERLEAAVLFAVQHQVHLAVSYSEIVTQINSAPIKKSQSYRLDDLIAAKERELTKITRYKQSLYQDWKDGEITQQEYRDMKADYERQTSDISAVLTRLNAERAELANGVDNEHPALVAFMKYQNIEALNREILVELVDYIKVYENGNISVKFKFADELRKIAEYIEINTTEDTAVAG